MREVEATTIIRPYSWASAACQSIAGLVLGAAIAFFADWRFTAVFVTVYLAGEFVAHRGISPECKAQRKMWRFLAVAYILTPMLAGDIALILFHLNPATVHGIVVAVCLGGIPLVMQWRYVVSLHDHDATQ
ncbi:MAG: hypothetical protein LKI93_02950 [Bifidobacteriaceae bacterium]|jgi:hypothetical protein|nr:hypothetical protein [Bifidobacteriaceae bacterium]MCI1915176.1 hypothetical protein [Bifidobacteriaceae bacterium]